MASLVGNCLIWPVNLFCINAELPHPQPRTLFLSFFFSFLSFFLTCFNLIHPLSSHSLPQPATACSPLGLRDENVVGDVGEMLMFTYFLPTHPKSLQCDGSVWQTCRTDESPWIADDVIFSSSYVPQYISEKNTVYLVHSLLFTLDQGVFLCWTVKDRQLMAKMSNQAGLPLVIVLPCYTSEVMESRCNSDMDK